MNRVTALLAAAAASTVLLLSGCAAAGGDSGSADAAGSAEELASSEASGGVSTVDPAVGSLVGGETITLSGFGFEGVSDVAFATVPAPAFSVVDDGTLTVVAPSATDFMPAEVPIVVTLADGSQVSTDAAGYSYEIQTPVDAQMNYAFTYWQDYNLDEWGVFSDNDCGNFVNQAMLARGWQQSEDWYSDYAATGDYSFSWIRGNEMDAYYASRPDTTRLSIDERDRVKIGDVVMFDWDPQNDNGVDHTMIVSKVTPNADGTIAIGMVGHTLDAQYRDLDNAITVEKPGGTAHFWSIA